MRILHVTPNASRAYGGPTYSLVAYSIAARSGGATVSIAAPTLPEVDREWIQAQLPNVDLHLFPSYGRGAFLASPALQGWLRRKGSEFDVIHVHGLLNPVSSLASRTCVRNRWPLVVRPFGTLSQFTFAHRRGLLKRAYMAAIESANLEGASAIHFTTDAERDASTWHAIEWGERARVVPPPWIGTIAESAAHQSTSSTVLFLSRLHPVKNVELLIDAWPIVLRSIPVAKLVIAGNGDPRYVQALRARATTLAPSISFVGHADDLVKNELLASATIFALPSFHENFGISVLEALAAGLPAVITPEVQLSEFVRQHTLGVIAEATVPAFAAAIVRALTDNALRARCSADGPELVARYYSPATIGEELLQMYRLAIANSQAESVNA